MSTPGAALYTGRIYPGLRPFDVDDALLFFGRERQIDEMMERLEETRFLAVVGRSGSGKSSLVRAGLLPALRRGHLSGAGSRWRDSRFSLIRPGSDPMGALARALNETLGKRADREEMLRSGRMGLADASRYGRGAEENLLIVVDQFEEIFRFQGGREADAFVEALLAAAGEYEPEYRVYVVITLRSDYLGECARFRGLPEALNESQYLVPRMTREELREAIEGPAALGGVTLEPALVERLLNGAGDDPDVLPVLQHLLMRMWERREGSRIGAEQYFEVGALGDALNRHADAMYEALGERGRVAKRVFQRLIEKGREVRRPSSVLDLAAVAKVPLEKVCAVVDHFRGEGCHFLTSPDASLTQFSVVDISHESLIRQWKRLGEWASEDADWGVWYRRVEDRVITRGSWLVGAELEAAVEARSHWNEAWAVRYATWTDGRRAVSYAEVIAFLDGSAKRRRDEVARLRRTRAMVAAAAVVFAALAALAGYFWWSARAARNVALARQLAADSRVVREASMDRTVGALLGVESLRHAETGQGFEALWEASSGMGREVARVVHQEGVHHLAFSPDGTLVATAPIGRDVHIGEARTGRELAILAPQSYLRTVAFSWDGGLAATGEMEMTEVFESRTGRRIAAVPNERPEVALGFSRDGRFVAIGSVGQTARVIEAQTGREVARLPHRDVTAVAFSRDGSLLATGSFDGTARIIETGTWKEVAKKLHESNVYAVRFSPDGKLVATSTVNNGARVFTAPGGLQVSQIAQGSSVTPVSFSEDGRLAATGSSDTTARVFEAATGTEVWKLAHQKRVLAVVFSPDGTRIATGSEDGTARLFESSTGRELARIVHAKEVLGVAFSRDGSMVETGSADGTTRAFEGGMRRNISLLAHVSPVVGVVVSPDGALVATATKGEARVFEANTGREVKRLPIENYENVTAFSPDGTLVSTRYDVFEARTGLRAETKERFDTPRSPDGGFTVKFTAGFAAILDSRTGQQVAYFQDVLKAVAFSPDGKLFAAGSVDRTAKVIDTRTWTEIGKLVHQAEVTAVAFSPDSRLIATGSSDGTVRVFDARTRGEMARMALGERVWNVRFVEGGRLLRAISGEKDLHVTQDFVRATDLIEDACSKLDRNLTPEEWSSYLGSEPYRRKTCEHLNPVAGQKQ